MQANLLWACALVDREVYANAVHPFQSPLASGLQELSGAGQQSRVGAQTSGQLWWKA